MSDRQLALERARLCTLVEQIRLDRGLVSAIRQNDTMAVRSCLNAGANANTIDTRVFAKFQLQITTLMLAVAEVHEYVPDSEDAAEGDDGGYYCVARSENAALLTALLDSGADLHTCDYGGMGESVLMHAVRCTAAWTLPLLVERGADINEHFGRDRTTALHYSAACLDLEMTRLLLALGADVNAPNAAGRTPLMEAIHTMLNGAYHRLDRPEIIAELLERGADTTLRDIAGETVLDYFPHGLAFPLWYDARVGKIRKMIRRSARRR